MRLSQLSLRALFARPGRTILTLLSIVVGVAAVVSVLMATKATRRAYAELYESIAGQAALQVVSNGAGGFEQTVVEPLSRVQGIRAAVPVIQRPTILYFEGRRTQVQALGIDPALDAQIHDYTVSAGSFLGKETGVVIEEKFAEQLGITPGKTVKLLVRRGLTELPVLGLLTMKQAVSSNQGLVYLKLPDAQRLFRARGHIDTLYLALSEGANVDEVEQAIKAALPQGLRVEPPPSRSAISDESLMALRQGLNLASSLSVVVAAFIIMNSFLMSVSERRRQMAILRAVGGTRRQVMTMLMREAFLLGALGTALGMVLGIFAARWLASGVAGIFDAALPAVVFTPWVAAAGIAVGMGVTILASYYPAREAGKVSPLEGMRDAIVSERRRPRLRIPILGVVLGCVGTALIAAAVMKYTPLWVSTPGILMLLVAVVCMGPLGLPICVRIVARLLRPVLGFEAGLAMHQVLRRRSRSVLTVGALFVAISTGIGMGWTVLNDADDIDRWVERAIGGDFFVRAMLPNMSTGEAADMPPEVGEEIEQVPGLAGVRTARFVSLKSGDQPVVLVAREFRPEEDLYLDLKQGDPEVIRRELQDGAVVIGTVLANRATLKVGDTIPIDTEQGVQNLRIVGVASDYSAAGLVIYMKREAAEKLLNISGVDVYIAQAKPGEIDAVESALQKISEKYGLILQSYADIQHIVQGIKNGIIGCLWGLLILGFIVAAFGIANTLMMNVLEQGRELGLLRVVGMTRRQLRRTILSQALIMGLIGLGSGLIAGVVMAYITNITGQATLGHASEFLVRPWMLLAVFFSALAIVLVAGLTPAARAARLNPLRMLRRE